MSPFSRARFQSDMMRVRFWQTPAQILKYIHPSSDTSTQRETHIHSWVMYCRDIMSASISSHRFQLINERNPHRSTRCEAEMSKCLLSSASPVISYIICHRAITSRLRARHSDVMDSTPCISLPAAAAAENRWATRALANSCLLVYRRRNSVVYLCLDSAVKSSRDMNIVSWTSFTEFRCRHRCGGHAQRVITALDADTHLSSKIKSTCMMINNGNTTHVFCWMSWNIQMLFTASTQHCDGLRVLSDLKNNNFICQCFYTRGNSKRRLCSGSHNYARRTHWFTFHWALVWHSDRHQQVFQTPDDSPPSNMF